MSDAVGPAPAGAPAAAAPPARKRIEVAVGVMRRADGAVLLTQRPEGKPYSGWWEFPGGKLEAGESVQAALARELEEEVGVRIAGVPQPLMTVEHDYTHAHVRLLVCVVDRWDGEPYGREGQALSWQRMDAIEVAPLLPAAVPIIEKLRTTA